MNHTPNYQLSQWAKSDRVLMDDFNADNAKIDAALKVQSDALSRESDARAAGDFFVRLGETAVTADTPQVRLDLPSNLAQFQQLFLCTTLKSTEGRTIYMWYNNERGQVYGSSGSKYLNTYMIPFPCEEIDQLRLCYLQIFLRDDYTIAQCSRLLWRTVNENPFYGSNTTYGAIKKGVADLHYFTFEASQGPICAGSHFSLYGLRK